ncbi:MAG: hypothetical protein PHY29_09825 [Syntrophales bacterium]|nr:hypothetical protein [Syntrophales bacterium]
MNVNNPPLTVPAVSKEQAVILAVTGMEEKGMGFCLKHRRFNVRFGDDGVDFLHRKGGPDWHWQLTYAGSEKHALPSVYQGRVSPAGDVSKRMVSYERGGMVEQYLAMPGSIEQQFVIPGLIELKGGDLVIEGSVRSDGVFEKHADGWLWRSKGGVVSLGQVYVYDAKGAMIPAHMTATATKTRIVVGREALARAEYPVTIDPEVGTNDFRISDMGGTGNANYGAASPAVAYNSTNNEYLVVWTGSDDTGSLVQGENEIFGQRINAATGAEVGTNDFRISDMGPDGNADYAANSPAVAYNSTNNEYLVVWFGDDNSGSLVDGENEIFGQRINAATGAEVGTNDFRISDMGGTGDTSYFALQPAVAWNSTNNEYLVVWWSDDDTGSLVQGEKEIFGQRINAATGAEVGTNDFRISDMGGTGDTNYFAACPAIAYNSTNNEYLVVWYGDDDTEPLVNDELEIFGQRINAATGAEVGTNDFRISDMGGTGNANYKAFTPAIAWNSTNNEYLVVWTGNDNIGLLVQGEDEIFGQRINAATGAEVGTNDFRISDMGGTGDTDYDASLYPVVTWNSTNNEYLVVWGGDDDTGLLVDDEHEIFGQRIDAATGAEVGTNDFRISDMGGTGDANYDAFYPAVTWNATNNEYLAVWYSNDDTEGLVDYETEIFGQRLKSHLSFPGILLPLLLSE